MKPCISQATTMPAAFADDIGAFGAAGFEAVEIWLRKLETFLESHSLADAGQVLADAGVKAVAASTHGGLLLAEGERKSQNIDRLKRRLEWCEGLGIGRLTLLSLPGEGADGEHYGRAIENLREAADLAAPHGVTLALEPNRASRFCNALETAAVLVAHSDRPNLGVAFDAFHFYMGLSQFDDLALLDKHNLAWVQLCDCGETLRELADDADRIFPGDGAFRLDAILEQFRRIGYDGYVSLELLNPRIWELPPRQAAEVGLMAMRRVLGEPTESGTA